jgi:predicted alpha/beta-fold hydrolase
LTRLPHPDGGFLAADVDRRGASPALVCVHGFGGDRKGAKVAAFRRMAAEEGWSFVAPEMRGHGDSSGSIADLTLSGMVTDVGVAVDAVSRDASHVVLVGSSLGARVRVVGGAASGARRGRGLDRAGLRVRRALPRGDRPRARRRVGA